MLDSVTLSPKSITIAAIPDSIIPYEWFQYGFYCEPYVIGRDGVKLLRISNFAAQSTAEGYKEELLTRIAEQGYASAISTVRVLVVCRNIVGIDIDIKGGKPGMQSWDVLSARYRITPSPFVVSTKSGGRHYYYQLPKDGAEVCNAVDYRDSHQVYTGIDIRSGNGVLAAPMRVTEPMGDYAVLSHAITSFTDLPTLPDDLYAQMGKVKDRYVTAIGTYLDPLTAMQEYGVSEGSRNNALYSEMARLIGMGYTESEVFSYGRRFADGCKPPMDETEAENTIASAWSGLSTKPKESMLRKLREQFVIWPSGRSLDIIDLKGVPGSNIYDYNVFKKVRGMEFKLPARDVLAPEELDCLSTRQQRQYISMVEYASEHRILRTVNTIGYRPGSPSLVAEDPFLDELAGREIRMMYNSWQAPTHHTPKATYEESRNYIADYLQVVKHICCDNDNDAGLFLDWCAYGVQHPHQLIHFAPYFINVQGSGRGTVMAYLELVFGSPNCARVAQDDIGDKFNSVTSRKRLVWIDEMHEYPKSAAAGYNFITAFNGLVVEPKCTIELKGRDRIVAENYALIVLVSNFQTSLKVKREDRRIMPFINFDKTYKPDAGVYTRLQNLLYGATSGNKEQWYMLQTYVGHIYNFLAKRDVSGFNAGGHAPVTSCIEEIIEDSRHSIVVELARDIANYRGVFTSDVVSLEAVFAHCELFHPKLKVAGLGSLKRFTEDATQLSGDKIMSELRDIVVRKKREIPHPRIMQNELRAFGAEGRIVFERKLMDSPPALYTVRNHVRWRGADDRDVLMEYLKINNTTTNEVRMTPLDVKMCYDELTASVH